MILFNYGSAPNSPRGYHQGQKGVPIMKVQLLGIQSINFTNDSGDMVEGNNIYVAYADENVNGLKASKLFVNKNVELPKNIKQGSMLEISFNMKGKPEKIDLA